MSCELVNHSSQLIRLNPEYRTSNAYKTLTFSSQISLYDLFYKQTLLLYINDFHD